MKNFKHILSIFIITSLILVSCSKDDTTAEVNEVETFTRVVLKVGSDTLILTMLVHLLLKLN